jgi:hypothetical protein
MSDEDKDRPEASSTGSAPAEQAEPPNAFRASFLDQLAERDEPTFARTAETAGPWTVRKLADGFGLFRQGDTAEATTPIAVFERLEIAYLAAAVMPALGQRPALRIETERTPRGFPVLDGLEVCGRLSHFDEALVDSMNLLQALLSRPSSLALLLHAAGHTALELAGRMAVRLEEDLN